MAIDKKKTLTEIAAGPSEQLQAAYAALLEYSPNKLQNISVSIETTQQLAAQEGTVNPLQAGKDGVTAGMRGLLRQLATVPLAPWTALRQKFDAALRPSLDDINAVRDFESKKAAIEAKIVDHEANIIAEAEANNTYVERKREKEKCDAEFEKWRRDLGGRAVNSFGHTWLYFAILLAITSVEWLINYDAFFAWTAVPAVAAGFTIAMALIVALAAHVHGSYLKQRNSRFGPAAKTKGRDISFLALASIGLIVAVVVAGWARYSLAMRSVSASGPMISLNGVIAQQANPITDVYFSLGINLIVWLIGLVIAFMSHDENHDYMSAAYWQWWRSRQFNRIHRPWEKRIQLERAQETLEIGHLENATKLAATKVKIQRDMLEHVEKAEEQMYRNLANALQNTIDIYRIALGNALAEKSHVAIVDNEQISGQQYKQLAINLDGEMLRKILL